MKILIFQSNTNERCIYLHVFKRSTFVFHCTFLFNEAIVVLLDKAVGREGLYE